MKTRFGLFEADLEARELRKAGIRIKIHEQPFQVLEALLERPGEIVTRDELYQRIWPGNTFVDFDQSLNKAVNRLRAALGDTAVNPRFVETLSRRGYRLLVPVESANISAVATPAPAVPEGSPEQLRWRWRWFTWAALLGTVTVLIAVGVWLNAKPRRIASIVVLPFTNLSGDVGQEYFVDGITDTMTTELAQLSGLRIVSRTSAMHYKGAKKPIPVIARELHVDAVLEGALLRIGNRARLHLTLIQARADRPLWTGSYDTDIQDISTLQNDIVRLIASELRVQLNPEVQRQSVRTRRVDPAAFDAYLKGQVVAQQRTEPALTESVEYFQQAIAADPQYAPAYIGLANAYNLMMAYHLLSGKEGYPKQTAAARRGLQLDNTIALGHTLLGSAKLFGDWDWPDAEKHFKRAVEINSSSAESHQRYALALAWMGRFDEALAEIRKAQEIDPLAVIHRLNEGEIFYYGRQFDRAIDSSRRAIARDRSFFSSYAILGLSYVGKGMYDEGIRELQMAVSLGAGSQTKSELGYALARSGRTAEPSRIIDELKLLQERDSLAFDIAVVYAGLSDNEHAFEWLEKSYAEHSRSMVSLQVRPVLDTLRSDPRFSSLVHRVGLAR